MRRTELTHAFIAYNKREPHAAGRFVVQSAARRAQGSRVAVAFVPAAHTTPLALK